MFHGWPMTRRSPRRLKKQHPRDDLRAVVDETIGLFHRLRWVAEQIYGEDGRSTARRGILRGLARYGAQSVPQLARARAIQRQSVQAVVDVLLDEGLVRALPNPDHARSPLWAITARGLHQVAAMDAVDDRVLLAVGAGLAARDVAVTARTLRLVRQRFEASVRWRAAAGRTPP